MSDDKTYEVGYRKPPKQSRWKKGQSGNLKGRPKQVRDVVSVVEAIANEAVRGKGADAGREMTGQEAVYRREITAAMSGDQRAAAMLIREIKRCRLILPKLQPEQEGGYLVVPGTAASEEEWRQRYGRRPESNNDIVLPDSKPHTEASDGDVE